MSIRAKVIAPTTINSEPVAVGDVVTVDEQTFENLARKGRLELVESKPPIVETPTEETAESESETNHGDTAEKPKSRSKKSA